jgi:integrase
MEVFDPTLPETLPVANKYGIYLREAKGEYYVSHNGKKIYLGMASAGIKAAEAKYKRILAGETRPSRGGYTVKQLVDMCIEAKQAAANRGELSEATVHAYRCTGKIICEHLGDRRLSELKGADFTMLANRTLDRWGVEMRGTFVRRTRMFFRWGFNNDICTMPRFGDLKAPSKRLIRGEKAAKAEHRVWTQEQIRAVLEACRAPSERAAILLGIHSLTVQDCSRLEASNLDGKWLTQTREKTNIERTVFLSDECLQAVLEASEGITEGPLLRGPKGGRLWTKNGKFSETVRKRCLAAGIKEPISHHGLRRTFYSVASLCPRVQESTLQAIMAHAPKTIGGERYRFGVDRSEIARASQFVECWLNFPSDYRGWIWWNTAGEDERGWEHEEVGKRLRESHPVLF